MIDGASDVKAEWALYYAMIAAHVLGGGYTLVRGQGVHRLVLLVLAIGVALELVGVSALVAAGLPIHDVSVNFDLGLNLLMCSALLAVALRFDKDNWILLLMAFQACNLALDAFVFQNDAAPTRAYFADAANALNIGGLVTMALAAAWARRAPNAAAPDWVYLVQPA